MRRDDIIDREIRQRSESGLSKGMDEEQTTAARYDIEGKLWVSRNPQA